MGLILKKAKALEVFSKLLTNGEETTAVGIHGAFKQLIYGTTTNNRFIVAPVGFFNNKVKTPIIDVNFSEIKNIDILSNKYSAIFIIETNNDKKTFKIYHPIIKGRIDIASEAAEMYRQITKNNPFAAPKYMDGEMFDMMFRIKGNVVKLTKKHLLVLEVNDKTFDVNMKQKIDIKDIKLIDMYPTTARIGANEYIIIKSDNFDESFTIQDYSTGTICLLPEQEGSIAYPASIFFYEILKRNPLSRPKYIELDEEIIATDSQIAHSELGLIGKGVILRLTNKRFIELKKTNNNELEVVFELKLSDIIKLKITEKTSNNNKTYCLQIDTNDKKYSYFSNDNGIFKQIKNLANK